MAALTVNGKRRWNTEPRGWLHLCSTRTFSYFQIADLIKLNGFQTRIGNRQRITGYCITCLELMLGLSPRSDTDQKLSNFSSNIALNSQRITQIDMAHLIERTVQSDPRLDRNQHTVPRDFPTNIASQKVQAAFLSNLYS
jgi:hypothetical protein